MVIPLNKFTRFILTLSALWVLSSAVLGQGIPVPLDPNILSDQKPGSVLFFNKYISNAASATTADTQINITNTNQSAGINVHLFFVDTRDCNVQNQIIFLTPSQTVKLFAREEDPGARGYLIAVAIDPSGLPTQFNFLIGDAYIRESTGMRQANLAAISFVKKTPGLVPANPGGFTANLVFDGVTYDRMPRVVAVSSFNSQVTDNTQLVLYSPLNDLLAPAAATNSILAVVYDDNENGNSFTFSVTCYLQSSLSNLFGTIDTIVPSGRTGWIRLQGSSNIPLLGAILNNGPRFDGGHNLHHLTLRNTFTMRIPTVL
jgi:hypothetical protein